MQEILSAAQQCTLFAGMNPARLHTLLCALSPAVHTYAKGEMPVLAGYEVHEMGIVLAGRLQAVQLTAGGDELSVAQLTAGDVFGDMLAASGQIKSPVSIQALTPCSVAYIRHEKLFVPLPMLQAEQCLLLQNMMRSMAEKYFLQERRVQALAEKSLRGKVLRYLRQQQRSTGAAAVAVPTRSAMAAYLGCERSALCRVLSAMQAEGTLSLQGKSIVLLLPSS